MDPRTLAKYLQLGKLPSATRKPRTWRTRQCPFATEDLDWAFSMLRDAPEVEAKTLFDDLVDRHPDRYRDGQLRTFQRHIERWRTQHGPPREVFFSQQHRPGEAAQTDFTWVTELEVTIAGEPAPRMLSHTVLPYSNVEMATVCHSESMLAIRAGVQRAVYAWGRTPEYHQTDSSSAATHRVGTPAGADRAFNAEYLALMEHLGMKPRRIAIGESEQNGDVESANGSLKRALRQHLLLRGSRDFESSEAWQAFVDKVVDRRNQRRQARFLEDLAAMKILDRPPAPSFSEKDVTVGRGAIVRWRDTSYSVPSQLIGKVVRLRVSESHIEVWYRDVCYLSTERRLGRGMHVIDYRHVIASLVRKPGAFARYRYREAMFPTEKFRAAFDALEAHLGAGTRTDLEYLRLLHLAAYSMESEVEAAIALMLAENLPPREDAIRALVAPTTPECPDVGIGTPDPAAYDNLLEACAS
jgi:hypothetical protein